MRKQRKIINPFYLLLILAGMAFLVTACTYGVMSYRAVEMAGGAREEEGLMQWIDRHGVILMLAQVAMIGLFSVAAMLTEGFWERLALGQSSTRESTRERESNESATH